MAVALPDIPCWVEPRSLLLSGECEVFGAGEGGFVVRDPEDVGISIVGHPSASAIREAVARGWEDDAVFSSPESRSLVSEALPEWEFGSAIFHLTDDLSKFLDALTGTARIMEPSDIDFDDLPDDLRPWIEMTFARGTPVAAAYSDGRAVSFCCAVSATESLWDISVDTVPEYRNRGFAARCVPVMARHMLPLLPVWAAEESNTPSMRLAAKLGFVPVDALDVFHRHS
jgi:RimJ/RimL family protein N-acetyltransferase